MKRNGPGARLDVLKLKKTCPLGVCSEFDVSLRKQRYSFVRGNIELKVVHLIRSIGNVTVYDVVLSMGLTYCCL